MNLFSVISAGALSLLQTNLLRKPEGKTGFLQTLKSAVRRETRLATLKSARFVEVSRSINGRDERNPFENFATYQLCLPATDIPFQPHQRLARLT